MKRSSEPAIAGMGQIRAESTSEREDLEREERRGRVALERAKLVAEGLDRDHVRHVAANVEAHRTLRETTDFLEMRAAFDRIEALCEIAPASVRFRTPHRGAWRARSSTLRRMAREVRAELVALVGGRSLADACAAAWAGRVAVLREEEAGALRHEPCGPFLGSWRVRAGMSDEATAEAFARGLANVILSRGSDTRPAWWRSDLEGALEVHLARELVGASRVARGTRPPSGPSGSSVTLAGRRSSRRHEPISVPVWRRRRAFFGAEVLA